MLCYPTCFCICILEDRKNWGGISKISCPMNLKPLPENNRFLFGDRESEGKRVRKFVSKNKKSQSERERERETWKWKWKWKWKCWGKEAAAAAASLIGS